MILSMSSDRQLIKELCLYQINIGIASILKQMSFNKRIFSFFTDLVIKKVNDLAHLAFSIETSKKS